MNSEARKFISDTYRRSRFTYTPVLSILLICILAPICYFWGMLSLPNSTEILKGRIIATLIMGPPITLPLFFIFLRDFLRLKKDAITGELFRIEGKYKKCIARGGRNNRLSSQQKIKVSGIKLVLPVGIWCDIDDVGEAVFEYFPKTKWVWSINGKIVQ